MPADPRRAKDLFAAALDLPPTDRAAFLDRECDGELRRRVEALLAAHDDPASALERPLVDSPTRSFAPDAATADHLPSETAGMVVAGRYKLLESIGEGGMGEVWVADQLEPIKRRVALKLIKPGMDSRSVLARFEAERQALALMDHPNIAKVLDAGTTGDGRPYFVMELVKGTPITTFCDKRKLTPKERLELFVPVCQAIQHAHHKGIIHRDIKPSNVLVALHDEKPVPKVIDFGVAKAVGQQLTEKTLYTGFGALVGTPAYMAPEQATFNQLDIDTRADVYALGVLLYELLAGSPPIEKERLKRAAFDEVLRLVREEEPPRPSARLSTSQSKASIAAVRQSDPAKLSRLMRGELDWIVMKALEKDRTRRYDTANGFAADVRRYLTGEPVLAVPPSASYRLKKFCRRNRGPVIAAAVVIAALLAGVGGTTLGLIRAERSRSDAVAAREAEAGQRAVAEASAAEAREVGDRFRVARDELRVNLYGARSGLIQSAWEADGVARVRDLLGEQRPRSGEPDLRGFEWHYWNRRANAELVVGRPAAEFERARDSGRVISPDGRRQATLWSGRTEATVKVRDAFTGAEAAAFVVSPLPGGRDAPRVSLSFTPDARGVFVTAVAPAGKAGIAKIHWWIFDAATGKELVPHREAECAAIDPWEVGLHRSLVAAPVPAAGQTTGVRLKLWEAATGAEVRVCDGSFAVVRSVAFRPGGKEVAAVVATATEPAVVKVWDAATGRERLTLPGGSHPAHNLVWSPDGSRLAATSFGLRVWDAADGRVRLAPPASDGLAGWTVFSPDGGRFASTAPHRRFVTLHDTDTGHVRGTFKVPDEMILGTAFSEDGDRLVTVSRSGTARLWDATASELPVRLQPPADAPAFFADMRGAVHPAADGARFAAVGQGRTADEGVLRVWDDTGKPVRTIVRPCPPAGPARSRPFHSLAVSRDGRRAAWWAYRISADTGQPGDGPVAQLRVVDLTSGSDLWARDEPRGSGAEFSPDGHRLAVVVPPTPGRPAGAVQVLDAESGREIRSFPSAVWPLCFSADGGRLVGLGYPADRAGVRAYPLVVWDLGDGTLVPSGSYPAELVEKSREAGVALSPDGTRLAVSWRADDTAEGMVRLFEVPGGRELRPLRGLDDSIGHPAFSPDGTRLAAAGRVVKVWDVAGGHDLFTLREPAAKLEFSRDGCRLRATKWVGDTYAVKMWDATPRESNRP